MSGRFNPIAAFAELPPPRKRFTRREFDHLMDSGTFDGQRFELIDGDLIDKMGQNPPHAAALTKLLAYLSRVFGPLSVRSQSPIEISATEREWSYPEPDLAVTSRDADAYDIRHPQGSETLLVAEISDTTLRFDQSVKAGVYARAGVPEYWVVDVAGKNLYLHRRPLNGRYTLVENATGAETISPEAKPEATLTVADLFPPASR